MQHWEKSKDAWLHSDYGIYQLIVQFYWMLTVVDLLICHHKVLVRCNKVYAVGVHCRSIISNSWIIHMHAYVPPMLHTGAGTVTVRWVMGLANQRGSTFTSRESQLSSKACITTLVISYLTEHFQSLLHCGISFRCNAFPWCLLFPCWMKLQTTTDAKTAGCWMSSPLNNWIEMQFFMNAHNILLMRKWVGSDSCGSWEGGWIRSTRGEFDSSRTHQILTPFLYLLPKLVCASIWTPAGPIVVSGTYPVEAFSSQKFSVE